MGIIEGEHILDVLDLLMGLIMALLWGLTIKVLGIDNCLLQTALFLGYFISGYIILWIIHERR